MPKGVSAVAGLEENLRLQDRVAQKMKELRHQHGALNLEVVGSSAVFDGDRLKGLEPDTRNRAKDIIEDFMIAVNGVTARYLAFKQFSSLRRVVRTPKRWDRIVELAAERGATLTRKPDAKALEQFLISAIVADPVRFPDLSLSIIKLLGPGEYMVQLPGEISAGHFGLVVEDYSHSTAPNRRYPDLITQRLIKTALAGEKGPYPDDVLTALAGHCTQSEDAAKKVERLVEKSAAAILLETRIGQEFDGIVTCASKSELKMSTSAIVYASNSSTRMWNAAMLTSEGSAEGRSSPAEEAVSARPSGKTRTCRETVGASKMSLSGSTWSRSGASRRSPDRATCLTVDLELRQQDHLAGHGCRTTQIDSPLNLAHCEKLNSIADAERRETQVKGWSRAKKEALIRGDEVEQDRLPRCKGC